MAVRPPTIDPKRDLILTRVVFEDDPGGTRYTAIALHEDEADRRKHEEMGFLDGWGLCLERLVEVARRQAR